MGAQPAADAVSEAANPADPEAAYYQAVEEYFVSRRGAPLILSNADWNLVRKWRVAGVPLRVVLRGIRDALDAHDHGWSRERKVGSLAYCEREVDNARERWQRALSLGAPAAVRVPSALAEFAGALERSPLGPSAATIARAIACELREPDQAERSLAELSAWLAERERSLLAAILSDEPSSTRAAREEAVDSALQPWRARMPARVLQQLRAESLARRALEAYALPRLSLFHLEAGGEVGS